MKDLKCGACGRELTKVYISFTGCDWNTKAGEGSGFDCEIKLDCDCGRVYHIGNVRREEDFTPSIYLQEV